MILVQIAQALSPIAIAGLLALVMVVLAIMFAIWQYRKYMTAKRRLQVSELQEQLQAYHIEEALMASEIKRLRADGATDTAILTQFRDLTQESSKNLTHTRPLPPTYFN